MRNETVLLSEHGLVGIYFVIFVTLLFYFHPGNGCMYMCTYVCVCIYRILFICVRILLLIYLFFFILQLDDKWENAIFCISYAFCPPAFTNVVCLWDS